MIKLITRGTASLLLFASLPSMAQEATLDTGNTAWILASTALVLFMTLPCLAMFYGGLVRSKNVLSVLLQCFAIAGVVAEMHGDHRPYRDAEPLQRKGGGAVAHMTIGNAGLNR